MLKGSLVAIVTPMHDDGSLDLDRLRALVDFHLAEGTDGIVVEDRPETDRLSGTAVIHVTRLISLLLTAEHTTDPVVSDTRLLAGITYRLP